MNYQVDHDQIANNEHLKVLQILDNWYQPNSLGNIDRFIEEIKVIEKYSFNKKVYMLWDHVRFLPIYISNNVEKFGYTPEEVYKMSLFQAIKRVYWKQIPLLVKVHKDGEKFRKISKAINVKDIEAFGCGAKLKDKWGNIRTFFFKQRNLSISKKRKPLVTFIEAEDITHLYKSNLAWSRVVDKSTDIPIVRIFSSANKMTNELLSKREIEILKLITKNKDSASIAQNLNISLETVKKHRKNMIAKTGVKDMTALIYICKECDLI